VRAQDAEPLAVAAGRADGVGGGSVVVGRLDGFVARAETAQRRVEVRIGDPGQALACGMAGRDRGEAPLEVAAVFLQVPVHQRVQSVAVVVVVEAAAGEEEVGQSALPITGPGLKVGDELALVDQAVLKCEQTEEEMAADGGHGWASWTPLEGRRKRNVPRRVTDRLHYHAAGRPMRSCP
jgi:hypothetical protein